MLAAYPMEYIKFSNFGISEDWLVELNTQFILQKFRS